MGLEPIPIDISCYQLLSTVSLKSLGFQGLTRQSVGIIEIALNKVLRKVCHLTATHDIIYIRILH